jgi:NAD(P)-dependent dehydrogenase (short-subunit alcohol dehydrogenase family)
MFFINVYYFELVAKYRKTPNRTHMALNTPRRMLLAAAAGLALSTWLTRSRAAAGVPPLGAGRFDRTSTAEEVTAGIDLTGKTVLITGCSSGIGKETLRVLILRGAHVYGLAPTLDKAESGCAAARGPGITGIATAFACDHTDFASIVACANAVQKLKTPVDMLICNAGVNLQRLEQVNGIEKDFVINHLGHFILVNRLLSLVRAAPQGRVAVVGSGASYYAPAAGIEFDNLSGERDYDFMKMYGQSKLANGLFAHELARRLKGTTTTANVLTPGVVDTPMNRNLVGTAVIPADFDFKKLKTVAQGAATLCYVATSPDLEGVSGQYFEDCRSVKPDARMLDDALAARLWTVSEQLTRAYLLRG